MADVTCGAYQEDSGARCHLDAGHDLLHNAWAHYPGQLVVWPTTPHADDRNEES